MAVPFKADTAPTAVLQKIHVLLVQVDMYSLGIIAFELWHSFSTGMERVELLRDLRHQGKLPLQWEAENPQVR